MSHAEDIRRLDQKGTELLAWSVQPTAISEAEVRRLCRELADTCEQCMAAWVAVDESRILINKLNEQLKKR